MNEPPANLSVQPPAPRRISPKTAAAVGATVLAAAILAVVLLNVTRGETSDAIGSVSPNASILPTALPTRTAEPSASATGTPDPTPMPTPSAGAAEVAWTPGAVLDGGAVVARIGSIWLVGGSIAVNDASQAAVWTSADGQTWDGPTLLPPEPPAKPTDQAEDEPWFPDRYSVTGFGEWQGTLLALGYFHFGCCDGYVSMLWQSVDGGTTWSKVETDGTAFGTAQVPLESTARANGELAIFSATGLGGGASMFITSDLARWSEHPIGAPGVAHQFGGFGAAPEQMAVVGADIPPFSNLDDRRPEQRAWRSLDGRAWSPMTPPDPLGELSDVAWDPANSRWVVVGVDEAGRPRSWISADGVSWVSSQLSDEMGLVGDVAVANGLIAAVGSVQISPDSEARRIVWSSHDGVTWWVVEIEGPAVGGSVATTSESAVIVFGPSEGGSETWIGLLAD
jgi:hypothetical protein